MSDEVITTIRRTRTGVKGFPQAIAAVLEMADDLIYVREVDIDKVWIKVDASNDDDWLDNPAFSVVVRGDVP